MEFVSFIFFELLFVIAGVGVLVSLGRKKLRLGQIAYGVGFLVLLVLSPIAGAYANFDIYEGLVKILGISNLAWEATLFMPIGMALWLVLSCAAVLMLNLGALKKAKEKAVPAVVVEMNVEELAAEKAPVVEEVAAEQTPAEETPAEAQEAVSLSESFKIAAAVAKENVVSKETVVEYLSKAFGEEVELNHRDNYVSNGRLMLADTHYTITCDKNGKKVRKCFAYVYENNDGVVLLLIKTPAAYAESLKEHHEYVNLSAFPKTRDGGAWYSVPVDESWTAEQVYAMLSEVKALNDGEQVEHKELSSVSVAQANALMSDAELCEHVETGARKADKTKKIIVNLDTLCRYFENGETITLAEIIKRVPGTPKKATFYKVLARGVLDKSFVIDADDVSKEAQKMIALMGGRIVLSVEE